MSTAAFVHSLSDLSRADVATAGGKGANLGEMIRIGLPVPPGFVVSTSVYARQVGEWKLADRLEAHLAANDWEAAAAEAAAVCQGGAMLPEIERAIREAYRDLGGGAVAVRSSATAEDMADASFAGQQETTLDVSGEEEVLAAVRRCWASLHGARALHYRHARGIDHRDVTIAVVVQRMVEAEVAGVLFTVDPVDLRSDQMLLSAAPGLGESIVSGHRRGDTYRLRRNTYGESAPPANQQGGARDGGLTVVYTDLERPDLAALSDDQILEMARLGLLLEAHFACPQDVEFAAADGRLFLLQSRPITTLGAAEIEPIEPLAKRSFFARRSMGATLDRFPVAPKPLDRWIQRENIGAVIHMLRHVGFAVSEAEERAIFDVVWREAFVPPSPRPTLRLLAAPVRAARSLGKDWKAWWAGEPTDRLRAATEPVDLTALEDAELIRRVDETAKLMGELLSKRFEPMLGMLGSVALRAGVRVAVGKDRTSAVHADLLGGLHTRTSATNHALFQLAQQAIAAGPTVADAVRSGRVEDLKASAEGRSYLASFDAFMAEYGHREGSGLYLSAPTWKHDPEQVWSLIRGFMCVTDLRDQTGDERHRAALEEVLGRLGAVPGLAGAFRGLLDKVRGLIIYREDSHFDLTRPLAAMQSIVAEMARRLIARDILTAPNDIFYLTDTEAKAFLCGNAPPKTEVEELIRRRRATYQVVNGKWQQRRLAGGASGDELRGAAASSGIVRGKARIVHDERSFDRLKPGEILVCPFTNPSWTPLFSYAAGVVTDAGGPGSHAAIVAREHGIPAVMGVPGATERIRDGQEIIVDGTEGRVTILRPETAGSSR